MGVADLGGALKDSESVRLAPEGNAVVTILGGDGVRSTDHRFHSPLRVAMGLLQGKSLNRTLFNLALERHSIGGRILDLGAKDGLGSYHRHLRVEPGSMVVHSDMVAVPERQVVAVDVEKPFPFADNTFDVVTAFHLFEHVFNAATAPAEVARVLRPGGRFLIGVPFLHEYHADPSDFIRLTDAGLVRTWEAGGLRCTLLEAIGEGLLTACFTKLVHLLAPPVTRPVLSAIAYLLTTAADRLISLRPSIRGKSVPARFALEYLGVFEKTG